MAFDIKQLALFGSVGGFNLWVYRTADAAATVDTAAYFTGDALNMMKVGDLVIRITYTDGTFTAVSTVGFHIVNQNDGSAIDIADALAVTVTDTD